MRYNVFNIKTISLVDNLSISIKTESEESKMGNWMEYTIGDEVRYNNSIAIIKEVYEDRNKYLISINDDTSNTFEVEPCELS